MRGRIDACPFRGELPAFVTCFVAGRDRGIEQLVETVLVATDFGRSDQEPRPERTLPVQ